MATRRRSPRQGHSLAWILLMVVVPSVLVLATIVVSLQPVVSHGPGSRVHDPHDYVRSIVTLLVRRHGETGSWPPYSGRNFILSLVAVGDIDRRRYEYLELLFPVDGLPYEFERASYEPIDSRSLATQRFSDLTELAGRRNVEPRYAITSEQEKEGTPLLGVADGRAVILGFSNGDVRRCQASELGIPTGEPIRFGDAAKHPWLRCLSDK